MLPFEGIEAAASREVDEETGLIGLTFVSQLGGVELGLDDPGGPAMTTYVHLIAPTDDRTDWEHTVAGVGEDAGMTFECRWVSLPLEFELAGGQGIYVDQLPTT
jgi:ADP-ribose pyrophosphatase YjhB (NUDIX family)